MSRISRSTEAFVLSAAVATGIAFLPSNMLAQNASVTPVRPPVITTSTANRPVVLVVDQNAQPVPYATVSVAGGTNRITDANGELQLNGIGQDSLRLIVRRIGYREHDQKVARGAPSDPVRVQLVRVAQSLDAVEVKGEVKSPLQLNGFYERMLDVQRGATVGEFFTPEMLQARPSNRFSALVQGSRFLRFQTVRGKMVLLGRSPGANNSSSEFCNMSVVLDGMKIQGDIEASFAAGGGPTSMQSNSQARTQDSRYVAIDDLVSGGDVSAIEVYPSNANAPVRLQPLTGGGSCGIVAIWTGGRQR